jgi:hypothetical protein
MHIGRRTRRGIQSILPFVAIVHATEIVPLPFVAIDPTSSPRIILCFTFTESMYPNDCHSFYGADTLFCSSELETNGFCIRQSMIWTLNFVALAFYALNVSAFSENVVHLKTSLR